MPVSIGMSNVWLVEGDDPLDPEAFTARLIRMLSILTEETGESGQFGQEQGNR